jgi:inosine-uridine nucleoside N-ribohydrolase
MSNLEMLKRLERPKGKIKVVLDTDAYNEIDDQFAIAYALLAPEKIDLLALYAAPFFNSKSTSPEDGMEKSYDEIIKLLNLAERQDMIPKTYRGSKGYLPDEKTPVESAAADDLIKQVRALNEGEQLYVLAIGAITNVASALIKAPEIGERIVVVWLGGNAWHMPTAREFNLSQDIAAARVVFDSSAALVQLGCAGVVTHLATNKPELEYWLKDINPLSNYLAENTIAEAESYAAGKPWSRVIWDISAVAWVLDEDEKMMQDRIDHRPIPEYDHYYSFDFRRPFMKYVWHINRDTVFEDLFTRLRNIK